MKKYHLVNNSEVINEIKKQNYFEERLDRIRNYNERLCYKINDFKLNSKFKGENQLSKYS